MGGKSGRKTQTSTIGPSPVVAPYLQDALSPLSQAFMTPQEYFPGETRADWNANTFDALRGMRNLALGGAERMRPVFDLYNQTIGGDFLSAPALNQAAQGAIRSNLGGLAPAGMSGGRGNTLMGQAQARAVSDAVANQYGAERARQQQALGMLPMMEQMRYDPMRQLANVGYQAQAEEQAAIDDRVARFNFEQMEPQNRMARYAGILGNFAPAFGRTQTREGGGRGKGGLGRALGSVAGYALGGPAGGKAGSMFGGGLEGMASGGAGGLMGDWPGSPMGTY